MVTIMQCESMRWCVSSSQTNLDNCVVYFWHSTAVKHHQVSSLSCMRTHTQGKIPISHVMQQHVMHQHVMQQHVMQQHVMQQHVMQQHVMQQHVMQQHVMQQHVMQQHVMQQHVMQQHVMQQHVMHQHVMQQHMMQQHVMQQHVMHQHTGFHTGFLAEGGIYLCVNEAQGLGASLLPAVRKIVLTIDFS